jgi:CheY-like chemotaxis protein
VAEQAVPKLKKARVFAPSTIAYSHDLTELFPLFATCCDHENQQRSARSACHALADTILVVDDEVLIRMVVAEHLRDCGYRVIEAGDGEEAIAVLQVDDRIDIVFSDIQMPKRNGFELAQWVRRERPGVQMMLTSGGIKAAEIAHDLCESGPLIDKPYDLAHIVNRIRALLGRSER